MSGPHGPVSRPITAGAEESVVRERTGMRRARRRMPALFIAAAAAAAVACADQEGGDDLDTPPAADTMAQGGTSTDVASPPQRSAAPSDGMQVQVWFARGEQMVPVTRTVAAAPDTLGVAVAALLAGPTPEEQAQGLSSWFSDATAEALRSARVTPDGLAIVDLSDLRRIIPNASSSLGSTQLLDALNATVFAASSADSIEYRFGGSCEAFGEFVQRGCIRYRRR